MIWNPFLYDFCLGVVEDQVIAGALIDRLT